MVNMRQFSLCYQSVDLTNGLECMINDLIRISYLKLYSNKLILN